MMKRNYLLLFLLVMLFAAPGVTAYLYYRNPQWLSQATTNKGVFLNPPLLFAKVLDGEQKWRLILWYPEECDKVCLQEVDKLARIRLALGRRLYHVQQWLVQVEGKATELPNLRLRLQEQDIKVREISKDVLNAITILGEKPKIVIANPEGYLVMAYEKEAKPRDIYHDIKQLLNTTETRMVKRNAI